MKIYKKDLKENYLYFIHIILLFCAFNIAIQFCEVAFNRQINISIFTIIFLFVSCTLIRLTSNLLSKALVIIWLWWLVFGCFFTAAHSIIYSGEDIDIESACFIYMLFLCSFQIGVFSIEKKHECQHSITDLKVSVVFGLFILLYPYLMFIESVLKIGFVPMLQGGDIIEDMYTLNYGKLYSYKIVMLFSILYAWRLMLNSTDRIKKFTFCLLVISYLAISLFDGKRVVFIAGMILLSVYVFKIYGLSSIKKWGTIFASILILTYSSISTFRSGGARDFEGLYRYFLSVGVEFKDFAWTVTYFEPFTIPNYSWVKSSIGSFVNGFFLSLLDIEKSELVHMDSARAWMDIYGISLGIRSGIISELWFEFGYWGVCVMFLFGLLLSKLTAKIYLETSFFKFAFLSLLYAYTMLAIMGQSSLFFGVVITAIYFYFAWVLSNKLDPVLRREHVN